MVLTSPLFGAALPLGHWHPLSSHRSAYVHATPPRAVCPDIYQGVHMFRKLSFTAAVAAVLLAAGCGGSSDTPASSSSGQPPQARFSVSGPLTPVQQQVSGTVLMPLANAAAGTPLKGVVICADAAVNGDALNIVNALANGVETAAGTQNPQAIAAAAPQVQGAVQQLALDLQQLLGAIAGGPGCGTGATATAPGSNPLAGSPLAGFGTALAPVLGNIIPNLGVPTGAGGQSSGRSLTELVTVVQALSAAFDTAVAQVPAQAAGAPVLGGALTAVQTTLHDLSSLLNTANTGSATATTLALQQTINHSLLNVLTKVVPVNAIEAQSGQQGVISTPVATAVNQLDAAFGQGLGLAVTPALEAVFSSNILSQLGPVLAPVNQLLPSLIGPLTGALAGSGGGSTTDPTAAITSALAIVTSTLSKVLGTVAGGGLPATPCVFAGTPLAALCTVLP
jgi:hypothetical protein